ncbi:hypothetical protein PInf_029309 [Phytophthora infestans]|nr:hypothetical protein PInf_029309 [Phytophthora infestans]
MAPPRRVTRRDVEVFMRRLSGYDGEERDRLVRKHREYIAGTLDRDANFGNGDEATLLAPPPPPTTGRRPRMTVSIKPKLPPKKQKKAAEAEEESGQEDDEDYVAEEEVINAEELLLPPNKSARAVKKIPDTILNMLILKTFLDCMMGSMDRQPKH